MMPRVTARQLAGKSAASLKPGVGLNTVRIAKNNPFALRVRAASCTKAFRYISANEAKANRIGVVLQYELKGTTSTILRYHA